MDSMVTHAVGEFTAGLRALADLLDETASGKPYDHYDHRIFCLTREEMLRVTRRLGGRWEKNTEPGDYFDMVRDLGGGVTVRVYTRRENVCERIVVGTKTVQRPAPGTPMVDEEIEIVEWVCPPSVLAEMRS